MIDYLFYFKDIFPYVNIIVKNISYYYLVLNIFLRILYFYHHLKLDIYDCSLLVHANNK